MLEISKATDFLYLLKYSPLVLLVGLFFIDPIRGFMTLIAFLGYVFCTSSILRGKIFSSFLWAVVFILFFLNGIDFVIGTMAFGLGFSGLFLIFNLYLKNLIVSLFLSLVGIFFCCFLPLKFLFFIQFLGFFLGLIALVNVFQKRKILKSIIVEYLLENQFLYVLPCMLIVSLLLFEVGHKGVYFWDSFHPIYELSIGRTVLEQIRHLNWPFTDYSYVGKTLKYHFLATLFAPFVADLIGIDVSRVVVVFQPIFLSVLFSIITVFFKRNFWEINGFFFLFTPLFLVDIWGQECLFQRTVLHSGTYFWAAIFVFFSFIFYLKKRFVLFVFCNFLLCFIKGSFFIPVMLGFFLLFMSQLLLKSSKNTYGINLLRTGVITFSMSVFFLFAWCLFFKGAHAHNLWIIFPFSTANYFINLGCKYSLLSWIWILVTSIAPVYFLLGKHEEKLKIFALISLIGIFLGNFVFSELIETNNLQFWVAAHVPLWLLWSYLFYKHPIEGLNRYFIASVFTIWAVGATSTVFIDRAKFFMGLRPSFCSQEFFNAYSQLSLIQGEGVLHSSYYDFIKGIGNGDLKFLRSALVGNKNFFCEGWQYKGLVMEVDYAERISMSGAFYSHFTNPSIRSRSGLEKIFDEGLSNEVSSSTDESKSFSVRMLYWLSLGKRWHLINVSKKVKREISCRIKDLKIETNFDFYRKYFKKKNIDFLVLENGDSLKNDYKNEFDLIYESAAKDPEVQIYRFK